MICVMNVTVTDRVLDGVGYWRSVSQVDGKNAYVATVTMQHCVSLCQLRIRFINFRLIKSYILPHGNTAYYPFDNNSIISTNNNFGGQG